VHLLTYHYSSNLSQTWYLPFIAIHWSERAFILMTVDCLTAVMKIQLTAGWQWNRPMYLAMACQRNINIQWLNGQLMHTESNQLRWRRSWRRKRKLFNVYSSWLAAGGYNRTLVKPAGGPVSKLRNNGWRWKRISWQWRNSASWHQYGEMASACVLSNLERNEASLSGCSCCAWEKSNGCVQKCLCNGYSAVSMTV